MTKSRDVDKTLVEFNKAMSLAGLTVLLIAFCPGVGEVLQWELLWYCMVMQIVHAIYSSIKYYGSNNIPILSTW